MKRKSQEYVPQFDMYETDEQSEAQAFKCKGCEKMCQELNDEGYCYHCEQLLLKTHSSGNRPNNYYEELLNKHRQQQIERITKENQSLKNFYGPAFKIKMAFRFFPTLITIILIIVGIFKYEMLCFAIIAAFVALIELFKCIPIFNNIQMLKIQGLTEKIGKNKPLEEKILLDEGNIVITEKFVYSFEKRIVIPIWQIKTLEKRRGQRRKANDIYFDVELISDKRFRLFTSYLVLGDNSHDFERQKRILNQLYEVNSEINFVDYTF